MSLFWVCVKTRGSGGWADVRLKNLKPINLLQIEGVFAGGNDPKSVVISSHVTPGFYTYPFVLIINDIP